MELENRIKKEVSEGIVRAILEDAGYRVIDSGIEKVIREVTCMDHDAYVRLGFPDAISRLPDFTVMDPEQNEKILVEVKYRHSFDEAIFSDERLKKQVEIFGKVCLVVVNGSAPDPKGFGYPERFVRCVELTLEDGRINPDLRDSDSSMWWRMREIHEVFDLVQRDKMSNPVRDAVAAFRSMLIA